MPPMPLMPPMMGSPGPAGSPSQNPGLQAEGVTMVREAVQLLQKALPSFPLGSPEHDSVMQMITKGAKLAPASEAIPGVQQTSMQGIAANAQKSAALQSLMRMMQQGQAGGAPPPGGPEGGAPGGGMPGGGAPPPMM